MFNLVRNDTPRYITVPQFVQITKLPFIEYESLYREGKIPIVRKDGESFVDLEAMASLVARQDEEPQ
jgi:hypothetical protein